ncbi:MAG: hypothetical protein JW866_06880 [Ignavibacteriales bacterium]|nr:hypothetical protein [Ignavibacteriales bacterium]
MKKIKILLVVLLLLILSNLDLIISKQKITSGIYGIVKRGPIKNIVREREPSEEPFVGRFNIVNKNKRVIHSFDTGIDGQFRIFLAEGEYTLIPDETSPISRPKFQKRNFTVKKDSLSYYEFFFETGII